MDNENQEQPSIIDQDDIRAFHPIYAFRGANKQTVFDDKFYLIASVLALFLIFFHYDFRIYLLITGSILAKNYIMGSDSPVDDTTAKIEVHVFEWLKRKKYTKLATKIRKNTIKMGTVNSEYKRYDP